MTNKEIKDFLQLNNISDSNFSNHKDRYLKTLSEFCKYEKVYGGVNILDIYCEEFVKPEDKDVELYKEIVENTPNQLTSISAIVDTLNTKVEYKDTSDSTLKYRMTKAGVKAFGVTKDKDSKGIYGSRHYMWAIKTYDVKESYRYFTPEEKELFDTCTKQIYDKDIDRVQQEALLEQAFKEDKDMTKEEYFRQKEILGLNVFYDVIDLFMQKTGLRIVRATQHEIENGICFKENEDEEIIEEELVF